MPRERLEGPVQPVFVGHQRIGFVRSDVGADVFLGRSGRNPVPQFLQLGRGRPLDKVFQQLPFRRTQLLFDSLDCKAAVRIAGDDRRPALPALQHRRLVAHHEVTALQLRTMARVAAEQGDGDDFVLVQRTSGCLGWHLELRPAGNPRLDGGDLFGGQRSTLLGHFPTVYHLVDQAVPGIARLEDRSRIASGEETGRGGEVQIGPPLGRVVARVAVFLQNWRHRRLKHRLRPEGETVQQEDRQNEDTQGHSDD